MKFIIGIDEAGRGPLAGPVTVGAFSGEERVGKWIVKHIFNTKLRDSKKLSHNKREEIYKQLLELKLAGKVDFAIAHSTPKIIDKIGISKAIKNCIKSSLSKLTKMSDRTKLLIRLDGLLKAPQEFKNQKTIIKGDGKDVFIACASIVAKVTRDRLMCKLAQKYPHYSLEIHKGYGTKIHRDLIRKFGLSEAHRKCFCKKLTGFDK